MRMLEKGDKKRETNGMNKKTWWKRKIKKIVSFYFHQMKTDYDLVFASVYTHTYYYRHLRFYLYNIYLSGAPFNSIAFEWNVMGDGDQFRFRKNGHCYLSIPSALVHINTATKHIDTAPLHKTERRELEQICSRHGIAQSTM